MTNSPELSADGSWMSGPLTVRVHALDASNIASADLLTLAPEPSGLLAWLGEQQEVVGWGEAARIEVQGEHAIREASSLWNALVTGARVTNDSPYEWASRAPFALGSFGFAADTPGFLIVPAVALVRRGDEAVIVTTTASGNDSITSSGTWDGTFDSTLASVSGSTDSHSSDCNSTRGSDSTITFPASLPSGSSPATTSPSLSNPIPVSKPSAMFTQPGRMTQSQWRTAVSELIASLNEGAASKVVLARDIVVSSRTPIDERFLASRLRQLYPSTWVFAVNGLIGATPEMLAALNSGMVTSRVLAGTAAPSNGTDLFSSMKNRTEHHFAVESVARALAPLAESLDVPTEPFLLQLPNVVHLATEVTAHVPGANVLDIVGALHPTAAVCGTPTKLAFDLLERLEGTERGRYTGPVGWVDRTGAGEFGIALRCGQLSPDHRDIRVFAGGGIMPDSIPGVELAETHAKMRPVLDALGLDDSDDTSLEGAEL